MDIWPFDFSVISSFIIISMGIEQYQSDTLGMVARGVAAAIAPDGGFIPDNDFTKTGGTLEEENDQKDIPDEPESDEDESGLID